MISVLFSWHSLFFNKHGNDPTKQLRETGRFLFILLKSSSVYSLEEAIKPANFHRVVQAVKEVSSYSVEKQSYTCPSLALKLGIP